MAAARSPTVIRVTFMITPLAHRSIRSTADDFYVIFPFRKRGPANGSEPWYSISALMAVLVGNLRSEIFVVQSADIGSRFWVETVSSSSSTQEIGLFTAKSETRTQAGADVCYSSKRLELLRELVPSLRRIAIMAQRHQSYRHAGNQWAACCGPHPGPSGHHTGNPTSRGYRPCLQGTQGSR
jgi:hypothetical protein